MVLKYKGILLKDSNLHVHLWVSKKQFRVLILDSMLHFFPAFTCSSCQTHNNQSCSSLHTAQTYPYSQHQTRDLWGSHLYHCKGLGQLPGWPQMLGFAYNVQRKANPLRKGVEETGQRATNCTYMCTRYGVPEWVTRTCDQLPKLLSHPSVHCT